MRRRGRKPHPRDVGDAVPYEAWGTWEQPSNWVTNVGKNRNDGRAWKPAPTEGCSNARISNIAAIDHAAAAKRNRGRRCDDVRKFRDTDLGAACARFMTHVLCTTQDEQQSAFPFGSPRTLSFGAFKRKRPRVKDYSRRGTKPHRRRQLFGVVIQLRLCYTVIITKE